MDATNNELEDLKILPILPNIKLFKKGDNTVITYTGDGVCVWCLDGEDDIIEIFISKILKIFNPGLVKFIESDRTRQDTACTENDEEEENDLGRNEL